MVLARPAQTCWAAALLLDEPLELDGMMQLSCVVANAAAAGCMGSMCSLPRPSLPKPWVLLIQPYKSEAGWTARTAEAHSAAQAEQHLITLLQGHV